MSRYCWGVPSPFVLLLNLNFWNYYVPSRAFAREPPFNHLDSTSPESILLCTLAHNCHLYSHFSQSGKKQGERRAEPMSAILSPTYPPPRYCYLPHLSLIHFQGKIHAATRHYGSLRTAAGIFSFHFAKLFLHALTLLLLCYILSRRERTLWRQKKWRRWSHRSSSHLVGRRGKGSTKSDVVTAARPGGKGRVPHPGGPPISGRQWWQHKQQQRKGGKGLGSSGSVGRSLPPPPKNPPVTGADGRVTLSSENWLDEVCIDHSTGSEEGR